MIVDRYRLVKTVPIRNHAVPASAAQIAGFGAGATRDHTCSRHTRGEMHLKVRHEGHRDSYRASPAPSEGSS